MSIGKGLRLNMDLSPLDFEILRRACSRPLDGLNSHLKRRRFVPHLLLLYTLTLKNCWGWSDYTQTLACPHLFWKYSDKLVQGRRPASILTWKTGVLSHLLLAEGGGRHIMHKYILVPTWIKNIPTGLIEFQFLPEKLGVIAETAFKVFVGRRRHWKKRWGRSR